VVRAGGQEVKLADFAGSTLVLYFYPKDGTPGCTAQACELRDSWGELQSKVELFGISGDSVESHQKFIEKHGLPFPLLSDPNHEIIQAYQIWVEKSMHPEACRTCDATAQGTCFVDSGLAGDQNRMRTTPAHP
jgi:peroxiredoxin Q/BCP